MIVQHAPFRDFGPRCVCGHLGFVHEDGEGHCLALLPNLNAGHAHPQGKSTKCHCRKSTVVDSRWNLREKLEQAS